MLRGTGEVGNIAKMPIARADPRKTTVVQVLVNMDALVQTLAGPAAAGKGVREVAGVGR